MVDEYVEIPSETLRKAHVCMVEILREIDRICTKHNITWFLAFGTTLGAVRHQGFILWDDDCDIGMPCEDYNKFLQIIESELSDKFFFQTKETDPHYGRPMVKIRMNGTKLVEHHEGLNEKYHQGIFVDIFSYDYFPLTAPFFSKVFNVVPKWRQKRKKYPRGDWRRMALAVLTGIPYAISSFLEKLYILYCMAVPRCNKSLTGSDFRMNGGCFNKIEVVFPVRKDMTFEGCYFPMPANPDEYLRANYGDYMELPPVEKRHTHAKLIEC